MSAIGKGDWVECVNARRIHNCCFCGYNHFAQPDLSEGALYQVAEVTAPDEDGERSFILVGRPKTTGLSYRGFFEGRFRPIYRPSQSIIEQLKQPAPDIVRETENA